MKVTSVIVSAAFVAATQALVAMNPAIMYSCQNPITEACEKLCVKCMPMDAPTIAIKACFEHVNFDRLCIPKA
ncbi:hypothetical protein TWF694_009458 [Orbilia ellipsospora]|uniref:Uncharacterized protein n=1 Tax=Orbilia ellipsospora TaxID=2528407 RepID=A0AAV9XC08_9PEZI